jgi:hypothetical protein
MATENDKTTTQIVQKEEWKQPEITELDINKTETGALIDLEVYGLSGPS